MNACPPLSNAATVMKSVHHDCIEEENKYRWLESEKAGYDLGEGCVNHWVQDHWTGYLRARWVEHLQGRCFWIELAGRDFGLLLSEFQNQTELLNLILNQLKTGGENLDVITWAIANNIPIGPVYEILEALDVNGKRLAHRFNCPPTSGTHTA